MAYQADDYTDLVTTTLRKLERVTWADIVTDLQRHVAMPLLLKKNKVSFGSGYGYQFNVRLMTNDAAENVKLAQVDNPTEADTQKTGNIPWRHCTTHWAVEERVLAMNSAPEALVSLLETKRVDAMTSLAELLEQNFWTTPTTSSDDLKPYGIPHWVVKNATEGFTGANPSGFSSGAGNLSSTTYTRWKNWSGTYTNVTKADLIRKLRKAATKCEFRHPVPGSFSNVAVDKPSGTNSGYNEGRDNDLVIATVYSVLASMEEILEAQNDNLGSDVASKDGMTTFRRTPVLWAPYLDENDSSNPVYGLNFRTLKPVFLSGEYLKETRVQPHPNQHRTLVQYIDATMNFCCNDRRRQFVLYVA